jgi:para-nitrobenzyl esterase
MRNPLAAIIILGTLSFTAIVAYTPGSRAARSPIGLRDPFTAVRTRDGLVSGTISKNGNVHIFRGIPFAAPPIGARRWRAPQPVTPWSGIRKCDSFGPSPMQAKPAPFGVYTSEFLIPVEPISEDCLYLNVWTAAARPAERRPVLVYIYGGGFVSGGSACAIYDGEAMANKGLIFVSINYRVGIFGFFSYPGLSAESGHNASGNYGLMDQIAALRWVKENIAAFGGDPANVTIAGQSAGSMSVSCLVASPLAKGLFKRAIGESVASVLNVPGYIQTPTLRQAEEQGSKIAAQLNASDLTALRAISADQLLRVAAPRGPIIDGYVLPETPGGLIAKHRYNLCDLLTGWNNDDWLLFGPAKNAAQFKQQLQQQFGARADSAQIFYPSTDDATALTAQEHLGRDMLVGIQNYTWANLQSDGSGSPGIGGGPGLEGNPGGAVFVYRFGRRPPATGDFVKYGAFHTAEVPYAYGNLAFFNRRFEPVDYQLSSTMSSYWANFARTGNPNGPGLPLWPRYDKSPDARTMILDESPHSAPLPDKAALDFLLRTIVPHNQ